MLELTEKMPLDIFNLFADNIHDMSLLYEVAENYCEKVSISEDDKVHIMSHINLDEISGELLVTKIKNNPYIAKDAYLTFVENYVRKHKVVTLPLKTSELNPQGIHSDSFGIGKRSDCFGIGKHSKKYEGYRLITSEECISPTFVGRFVEQYQRNNGLLSLDDFFGDVLCNNERPLCIPGRDNLCLPGRDNGAWIRFNSKHITKRSTIKFKTTYDKEDYVDKNLGSICSHPNNTIASVSSKKIGLFIRSIV